MTDRCDTPSHWFLISGCGKPFFACIDHPSVNFIVARERRHWSRRGATLVRRSGNHARATLDEMRHCWPGSRIEAAENGTWLLVEPHEVIVGPRAEEEAA